MQSGLHKKVSCLFYTFSALHIILHCYVFFLIFLFFFLFCLFCRRKYLDHGCFDLTNKTEQPDQEISEPQLEEKLNVEEVGTEQHLEMSGGIEIPLEDIEMSLEGAEFVIPDNDNLQEMSLEGAEFVIEESLEIQRDDHSEVTKQSTKLIERNLTQSYKISPEETDQTLEHTFEPTTRIYTENNLPPTVKESKKNSSEEKKENKIRRHQVEVEFRETDNPTRRYS